MRSLFRHSRLWLALGGLLLLTPVHAELFHDVPMTDADCIAIEDIALNQLMEGFPDGNFRPERTASRAEGLMVMARLLNISLKGFMILPGETVENPDLENIPQDHWLHPAAMFLAERGMIDDTVYQNVASTDPMTRAEFLASLARLLHAGATQTVASAVQEFENRGLFPEEWSGALGEPITRREMARLLDRTLYHLTQHAVAEGTVMALETDEQGQRWVYLDTPIGQARLYLPTRGVVVVGNDEKNIAEGMKVRTISDAVSGAGGRPFYRVREVTILPEGESKISAAR